MNERLSSSETCRGDSGGTASNRSARVASSSRARGLPAVARCNRASRPRGTAPVVPVTSSVAASSSRPVSASVGRELQTALPGSPVRVPTSTARASENTRRAAKTSASHDGRSRRWASSTSTAIGRSSAARASRLSVAAPTAKRLGSGCATAPRSRADDSAPACATGMVSSSGSTGRRSCSRPANGTNCSDSTPRARSTRMLAASVSASASSALLPMPGSPLSTSTPLSPTRAPARSISRVRRSECRPTSISSSLRRWRGCPSGPHGPLRDLSRPPHLTRWGT